MKITTSALSLNVADEQASAQFARDHVGFVEEMANDGFVSLSRPDAGFNLISCAPGCRPSSPTTCADTPPTACSWSSSLTTSTASTLGCRLRAFRSRRRSIPNRGVSATSK